MVNYQAYFFCCFLLAAGVSISQLRKRGPGHGGFIRGRLIPAVGVNLFFCLISIFASEGTHYPLVDYLRYVASLFFIHF
jgi:hypothetical protein